MVGPGTAVGTLVLFVCVLTSVAIGDEPKFDRVVIDDNFPGAYQVEVVDINRDKKLDVVAVGGGTCAWYENPTWKKRIITGPDNTPSIISSASAYLGGHLAETAIAFDFAMNEPNRGKILWVAPGASPDDRAAFYDLGAFPSVHRIRWGNIDGDEHPDLIVAPIFGPTAQPPNYNQSPAKIEVLYHRGAVQSIPWKSEVAGSDVVIHAIRVLDLDGDGRDEILTAGNSGVTLLDRDNAGHWTSRVLVSGAQGDAPNRGCSEIHVGKFANGRQFLATIEPWHGNSVVVYPAKEPGTLEFGLPSVIDETLDAGHALWVADIDGDGDDEIFAGHRGKDHRISMYDSNQGKWHRTVIDREIAAQDLRGGDLDGDGTPDIVAVGGATHNVVWYRPVRSNAAGK